MAAGPAATSPVAGLLKISAPAASDNPSLKLDNALALPTHWTLILFAKP